MKYDINQTNKYIKESSFIIHGFLEQIFCKGKLISENRHNQIPHDAKVGCVGELFSNDQKKNYTLRNKKTIVCSGVSLNRVVIPICGRFKKK